MEKAATGQQFIAAAGFDDAALVDDEDSIGVEDC